MHADEDHPPNSGLVLRNRRGAIRVFGDHVSPLGKLRTVLPVLIHRAGTRGFNHHRLLANSQALIRVDVEPDPVGEVQSVVNRIAAKKSPSANPQVVQAAGNHSIVNVGGSRMGQVLANRDRVAARHNQKLE